MEREIYRSCVMVLITTIFMLGCGNGDVDVYKEKETEDPADSDAKDSFSDGCNDAAATGEEPVIADFDDGTFSVLPNEGRDGYWYSYDDGTGGTFTMNIESGVAHITSSGWTDWGCGIECSVVPFISSSVLCSYDASVYAGVRFKAKGTGRIRINAATVSNVSIEEGGTCDRGYNCYDRPLTAVTLTDEWQMFELPFCAMKEEGWGGKPAPVDPSEFAALHFALYAGQDVDFWLDDLAFYTEADAEETVSCEAPCPMESVPYPETIVPEFSYLPLTDELTLHTFDQETASCGPITRRYLSFVPGDLETKSSAPVLIALHGSSTSAETFQDFLAHGRLDELASRDGFIVVYGNAAQGAHSSDNPDWYNTGSWRQDLNDDGQVDDVAYLDLVLANLKADEVISGDNDLYLIGLSNGGGMVLKAAKERPDMFKGIAPFMPFDGWEPTPVPDLTGTGLERVIFGYAPSDPGLPDGYDEVLSTLPFEWARALGLPDDVIQNPKVTDLPDLVSEGEDYTGDNAQALGTMDSTVLQLDMSAPDVTGRLRILKFERGGHLWPNPIQDTDARTIDSYGFRNQDLDASDAIWSFFRDVESK
jgi:poly(3-hydroxybutyrate) depolymerase